MIVPIKLAVLKANGRRFMLVSENEKKVRTKGEVQRVSGFSTMHGPDRLFLRSHVDVVEVDLTEELLNELLKQDQP